VDVDLDATDRKLLFSLQENARRSVTELGRVLNLSRTAVQARLARLERDGVIVGYTAILRTPAVNGLSALLSLRFDVRPCSLVLDRIRSWPEILHGYSTAGPTDAVLVVRVSSTSALSSLTDKLAAVPGVKVVETTLIIDSFAERAAIGG
jgi:DNA-binding Lrp family transcriptional regulator